MCSRQCKRKILQKRTLFSQNPERWLIYIIEIVGEGNKVRFIRFCPFKEFSIYNSTFIVISAESQPVANKQLLQYNHELYITP